MENKQSEASAPAPIAAQKALFIKLGDGGAWEADCIKNGSLRVGYRWARHSFCTLGDWEKVANLACGFSKDKGAATRHANQLRQFYEADESTLWVTFHADRLWWCFSSCAPSELPDNTKERKADGGWKDTNINGDPLLKGDLSGKLLAVQGFQGTICTVSDLGYLVSKINARAEPHVAAAQAAYENLQVALIPIIQKLHPKDLETLTDLVFRQSGWQRVGVSGGIEKDIDLDLKSPVTGERIAVQVKSRANAAVWRSYRDKYANTSGFDRFYFVTHSPDDSLRKEAETCDDKTFILWDVMRLSAQAVRGGLTGWLLDKAS